MSLVGLGFTTSNAVTNERIQCDVQIFGGDDLNSRGATDSREGFAFTNVGSGQGRIEITKKGFIGRVIPGTFPNDFPANVDFPMTPDGSPQGELHLEVRGNDVLDAQGRPTCYSCVDQFQALLLFKDGRLVELEALVTESHDLGFQWWRIMGMGAKSQNTLFDLRPSDPGYYEALFQLARWLNQRGIGLLFECYADNQIIGAGLDHWTHCADALRGTISIISGGNEHEKNGFDPQSLSDPGMIWSRGSALADVLTPQNGATCASFHQRTDYDRTLMDAIASACYMDQQGYTVKLMDEPTRWNLDGSCKTDNLPIPPARLAFQLASCYRAKWALACFHNQAGQRGILMPPPLRACAAEWARGLKSYDH